MSSFEAAVKANSDGISTEIHSAAAFAHSFADSLPAQISAAAMKITKAAGLIRFISLNNFTIYTVLYTELPLSIKLGGA